MNANKLSFEQAVETVSKSYFLDKLVGKSFFNKLKKKFPDLNKTSLTNVLDIIPNLEDAVGNINVEDKFLTFQLLSDDEGGSESGPWYVTVHGVCGVWIVSSIEYEDKWYSDRNSAISAAYDYAHESVLEENDYGISEFQLSNSEVDSQKKSQKNSSKSSHQKSNPENRVLDFYLDGETNQIFGHFKYGSDVKEDIFGFLSKAFRSSPKEIEAAISNAKRLSWHDAVKALNIVIEENKRVEELNSKINSKINALTTEIAMHKASRITEIEVDDWLRTNGIKKPKMEDFVKCAKDLKPFFRFREHFEYYDKHMPETYRDAFLRLAADRQKIKDSQSHTEE
jgi:hypothetical protein